jgi:hypothetical protein
MREILTVFAIVGPFCSVAWIALVTADTQSRMQRMPGDFRRLSTFTKTNVGQK